SPILRSQKESYPSSLWIGSSLVFDLELPILDSVIGFPIFIFVRGVIFLVFMKGPSYHHLLHMKTFSS
ncbi:Hypothetical protein FKW44_004756, partial [Caligus rogercresseyi]